jgi:hypothetical protein
MKLHYVIYIYIIYRIYIYIIVFYILKARNTDRHLFLSITGLPVRGVFFCSMAYLDF